MVRGAWLGRLRSCAKCSVAARALAQAHGLAHKHLVAARARVRACACARAGGHVGACLCMWCMYGSRACGGACVCA
eukprot:1743475-Alexandrium_andersonii.AAC.1